MTPRSRARSVAPIALALCLALLASCGSSAAPAATLGGVEVTDAQLAHEEDVFGFLAGLNQQPCGTVDGDETEEAACARFALTNLIQEHFVSVYAKDNDIKVTDAQVANTVSQLDDSLGKKAVDDQLKAHDLTRADLSDLAHRILLFGAVQTAVASDATSEADLRKQYEDNLTSYVTVQVDHILVKTKAEADDVYAQVTAPGRHRAGLPGPREGGLDRPVRQAELRQPGFGRRLHVRAGVRGGRDRAGTRRDLEARQDASSAGT